MALRIPCRVRFADLFAKSPPCPPEIDDFLCVMDDYVLRVHRVARLLNRFPGPKFSVPTDVMLTASQAWAQRAAGNCVESKKSASKVLRLLEEWYEETKPPAPSSGDVNGLFGLGRR